MKQQSNSVISSDNVSRPVAATVAPVVAPEAAQTIDVSWIVSDLLRNSLAGMDLQSMFETVCRQLHASGIGISRAHIALNTLHPLFRAISHTWCLGEQIKTQLYGHNPDSADWLKSPLYFMIHNQVLEMRRHLVGPEMMLDFPVLENFAAQGYTDYRGYLAAFEPEHSMPEIPEGVAGSWCTSLPGGFTQLRLAALREIELALAVVCKVQMQKQMTENILNTYLGRDAGRQVRRGRIRHGDVESVEAVIWYSDMRGSTELAATRDGREFLADINEYFGCTAGAVLENGGEVLRFIGDAVLAIFPIRDTDQMRNSFRDAQAAMLAARGKMGEINQQRVARDQAPLRYGLGLHYGEVLFGNIGSPERLEFSVVGTAANEVARLEEMTKSLGHATLVSEIVAQQLSVELVELGAQPIRGADSSLQVFAVHEDAFTA